MLWDKSSWPERIVVIWGLLIASVAVLFVAVSVSNLISENSSNIANWVQALGSIVAIIATALIARSDGRHRIIQLEKIDAREKRVARFDLARTSILESLRGFSFAWNSFDSFLRYNELQINVGDYKELFFLNYTRDKFREVESAFKSLSATDREKIHTGFAGEAVENIMYIVGYFVHHYDQYDEFVERVPEFSKRKSLLMKISEIDASRFSEYNEEIFYNARDVMAEKMEFIEKIKYLEGLLK